MPDIYHDCEQKPNDCLVIYGRECFDLEDRWRILLESSAESQCEINYCPFCGQELVEGEE